MELLEKLTVLDWALWIIPGLLSSLIVHIYWMGVVDCAQGAIAKQKWHVDVRDIFFSILSGPISLWFAYRFIRNCKKVLEGFSGGENGGSKLKKVDVPPPIFRFGFRKPVLQ